jgi:hypothetical protein
VQGVKAPPSSWQPKATPASLSEKAKLASAVLVECAGALAMVGTAGGVRSIVHEKIAAGPVCPLASVALTRKVCCPSRRELYVLGLVQRRYLPSSSLHRNVLDSLLELNLKVALVWFVGFRGVLVGSIVTVGLSVSAAVPPAASGTPTTSAASRMAEGRKRLTTGAARSRG